MSTDWVSLMRELGRDFSTRAAVHDRDDSFVAENYAKLREQGPLGPACQPSWAEGMPRWQSSAG